MSYKIAIMKGDGIGPEISQVAESVINTIAKKKKKSARKKKHNYQGLWKEIF